MMDKRSHQYIINYYNYYDLIGKVAKIDINAALYLRNEAINLESFSYGKELASCFEWRSTPQGYKYWVNISGQLGELDMLPLIWRTL